ncbi:MAG TPA: FUSC family protein [Roseiarcus sp.]|nr:FUSC family protein [Roseiarcus sp.]
MAKPADKRRSELLSSILELLAPSPGRLEFATRLAVICALTTLVVEIYQTPDAALTAYLAFFVIKPDRTTSIIVSVILVVLMSVIIGLTLLIAMAVIDDAMWRVIAMTSLSFCLLFAASASKLKPLAATVALVVGYAIDLLGNIQIGEIATRALLYAWLFVGIPAGVCIVVNLIVGPAPRRLLEQGLADRLRLGAKVVRRADDRTREAFAAVLREGLGEIPAWLKAAGLERTSPPQDMAALTQAASSTAAILPLVDLVARNPALLPDHDRERLALLLRQMAGVLERGGYPTDIFYSTAENGDARPLSAAMVAELNALLADFAVPPPKTPREPKPAKSNGFFVPDAFINPVHVHYAIKTTAAAMFCYIVYQLLDWPGIHTCMLTCYIVGLGTAAETMEKMTLRILGCLIGAGTGLAAIVYLMPNVTSIGGLMAVVFVAALASGWVAAGGPRIAYAGFQIAFTFFLCVVQGSAPAFNLTDARDRVIGVLFGNLVVAVIFTQIWPVTVAGRIDPAIAAVLRKLAGLAGARTPTERPRLVVDAQTALGGVQQDLDVAAYEPHSIRPDQSWLEWRRRILSAAQSLMGPLLLGADQAPHLANDLRSRLDRVSDDFAGAARSEGPSGMNAALPAPETDDARTTEVRAFVEAPLAALEHAIGERSAGDQEQLAGYAVA